MTRKRCQTAAAAMEKRAKLHLGLMFDIRVTEPVAQPLALAIMWHCQHLKCQLCYDEGILLFQLQTATRANQVKRTHSVCHFTPKSPALVCNSSTQLPSAYLCPSAFEHNLKMCFMLKRWPLKMHLLRVEEPRSHDPPTTGPRLSAGSSRPCATYRYTGSQRLSHFSCPCSSASINRHLLSQSGRNRFLIGWNSLECMEGQTLMWDKEKPNPLVWFFFLKQVPHL